ncbi:phospho-N-acetylmuramoyl-pentapeptide-transferase [Candidatus Margulisiibacteriota bacterium]
MLVISQGALFFSALIVSFLLTYPVIWMVRFFHLTQAIREEGPAAHQAKAGTPTLGGIGPVLTIIILALIFINFQFDWRYLALILLVAGFAAIGLADDLIKAWRRQNLGLTFWQKIVFQTLLACLFCFALGLNSVFYFLFAVFIIIGTANATNLTDGLNGLLAGTGGIALLSFAFLSARLGYADVTTFSLMAAGAVLAFLYFNFTKAKVFMGDVGSLAIGAALAGIAILIHKELSLVIIGGVFVVETLSVILQVAAYKLFKKRIFKMTPLHHHFELLGVKETTIVVGFWVVGLILGIIGIFYL